MLNKELKETLTKHKEWLENKPDGRRADLIRANLRGADLIRANLSGANLSGADLREANLLRADLREANLIRANLSGANLSGANLSGADLSGADLIRANLIRANLSGANLSGANLSGADLRGADLREACTDFSSWPLWCGSIGVSIDDETAAQLLYHALCNLSEEQKRAVLKDPIGFANTFHRVQIDDVPVIAGIKEHKQ